MAKRFSKRVTRKTKIRLTPKEAENILIQEFSDNKGNKVINRIRFKPQNPLEPDFKQSVTTKYKSEGDK